MEALIIGIVLFLAQTFVALMVNGIRKHNKETKNNIELLGIKHESFVEAFGYYEGNGLLTKYNELVEIKKSDKNWIREEK